MTSPNPLIQPLQVLFKRLNLLQGLLEHQQHSFDMLEEMLRRRFPSGMPEQFVLWTSLPVRDLTGTGESFPSGAYEASRDEYLTEGRRIISRAAAYTFAQAYEAFETFLLDTAGTVLSVDPAKADATLQTKFETKKVRADRASLDYWTAYARFAFRGEDNKKVLGFLRLQALALARAEQQGNIANVELTLWFAAASEVRHAVTHADSLLKKAAPAVTDHGPWFPREATLQGSRVAMQPENTQRSISTFVEYAFLIFKCLSQQLGLDWNVLPFGIRHASEVL